MKSIAFMLVATSLFAGCTADTSTDVDADDDQIESETRRSAFVKEGSFELYPFGVSPTPGCDFFTSLSLKNTRSGPKADLAEAADPFNACDMAVTNPNARTFPLTTKDVGCGSKQYEGKRRVRYSFVGPDSANFATIKITDHRDRRCMDRIAGEIVVEETVPGFPGAITTQYRSLPGPVADACTGLDLTACMSSDSCSPKFGPSACSADGRICTADMAFKGCFAMWSSSKARSSASRASVASPPASRSRPRRAIRSSSFSTPRKRPRSSMAASPA